MRFNTIKRNLWYLCEEKTTWESCEAKGHKKMGRRWMRPIYCVMVSPFGGEGGYFKIMLMRAVTSLTLISPSPLISHTSLL